MGFHGIIGHERPQHLLQAALAGGRVSHAWLFTGPEGVGKERVALAFAQALTCAQPQAPCGICDSCRRIDEGSHPDVLLVLPEAERVARKLLARDELGRTPSRDLRIADVRELERRLRLPPNLAGHKVAVITPAERMNQSAQNALLKTLEEPPADTTLVLITSAEGTLLPTIRSRCVRIPFAPLPVALVAPRVAEVRGCSLETARVLATIAGGSLGRALALDPETVEARNELLASVRAFRPGDGAGLVALAESLAADRDSLEQALDVLASWYRDVLAHQSAVGAERLVNADLEAGIAADAAALAPPEILTRLASLDEARRALGFNANPRLVAETFLGGWR